MTNAKDSKKIKKAAATLVAASLLAVASSNLNAFAANPSHEEFHSTGTKIDADRAAAIKKATTVQENPMGKQGPLAMMSNPNDPVVRWFEHLDEMVTVNSKTSAEVAILKRGFNQEVERVQEWSRTASRISGRYKYLALMLRNMQVPANSPGLKEYANLTADWFADSAAVYDELLKPRRAARTMEELTEGLQSVEDRAKGLNASHKQLLAMDMDLRLKYHVHMRQQTDALQRYVKTDATKEEIERVGGNVPR